VEIQRGTVRVAGLGSAPKSLTWSSTLFHLSLSLPRIVEPQFQLRSNDVFVSHSAVCKNTSRSWRVQAQATENDDRVSEWLVFSHVDLGAAEQTRGNRRSDLLVSQTLKNLSPTNQKLSAFRY
jgi:hypothetical protein